MALIGSAMDWYTQTVAEMQDPRTDDWFLMSSVWPTVAAVIVYLLVVILGQKLMVSRPAFKLNSVLIVYNFLLVLLSGYLFVEFLISSWFRPDFSLVCQPVDFSNDPWAIRLAKVSWWFYFSKIIELLDTVFFVLRKKGNQISFLHVYHHSTMPILWWVGVKFVPGGESYFSATINSLIHVLMYLYYLLSAGGPSMRKFLWWKKYMTTLQLTQFFAIFGHSLYSIYKDCGYPVGYNVALIVYMITHIVLFSNFYYQAYVNKPKHTQLNGAAGKPDADANGVVNGYMGGDHVHASLKKHKD